MAELFTPIRRVSSIRDLDRAWFETADDEDRFVNVSDRTATACKEGAGGVVRNMASS